ACRAVLDDLGCAADRRCQRWDAACCSFDQAQRHALAVTRQHRGRRAPPPRDHLALWSRTDEIDDTLELKAVAQREELVARAAVADDHAAELAPPLAKHAAGLEQYPQVLDGH